MVEVILKEPLLIAINKTDLEYNIIHPNYYNPKYLFFEKTSIGWTDVETVTTEFITGNFGGSTKEYVEEGRRFVRIQNFTEFGFNDPTTDVKYLSDEFAEKKRRVVVHDIVMAKDGEGTIGKTGYVFVPFNNSVLTSHAFIIRFNSKKMLPQFGYLFLRGKYGQLQIDQRVSGSTGQKALPPHYCSNLMFPVVDVQTVQVLFAKLIDMANYLNYLAEALVQWIPEFTMEYLGLEMPEESDELCFTVRPEEVNEDVDHRFEPLLFRMLRRMNKCAIEKPTLIGSIADTSKSYQTFSSYLNTEFHYVQVGDIDKKTMDCAYTKQPGSYFTSSRSKLTGGELVVDWHKNSCDVITEIPQEVKNWVTDNRNNVLRLEQIPNAYLLALWIISVMRYFGVSHIEVFSLKIRNYQ